MGPDDKPPPYAPGTYVGPPAPGGYAPPPQRTYQGGAFIPPTDGQYHHQAPYPPYPGAYPPAGPPPPGAQPAYGTVVIPPHMLPPPHQPGMGVISPTTVVAVQPAESIILVGGCPACRVGVLEDDFTCAGICMAIVFFPLGVLCCLAMKQRRCPNCGATFG